MTTIRKCRNCGKEEPPGKKYCSYCGSDAFESIKKEPPPKINDGNPPRSIAQPEESTFWPTVLKLAAIVAAIYFVGIPMVQKTDWYQKTYHPKKYWTKHWTKEIKSLEKGIKFDREDIVDAQLEIRKLEATADIVVAQEVNFAKSIGESTSEARRDAKEMIEEDINDWIEILRDSKEDLRNDKRKLERARSELAIIRKGE